MATEPELSDVGKSLLPNVAQQVNTINAALIVAYGKSHAAFLDRLQHGLTGASEQPPQPENGWVVGYVVDPTTGPDASAPSAALLMWPFAEKGTQPVCPVIPIPAPAPVVNGTFLVGPQTEEEGWFNMLPGDQTPAGTSGPATSSEGITGLFKKYDSPTGGFQGWFKKIN